MRKRILYALIAVALICITSLGVLFFLNHTSAPAEFRQKAGNLPFTSYYPSAKPYAFQKNSLSVTQDVLVFTLKSPTGKTVVITEQRTPDEFDTSSLKGDKEFKVNGAQAYITDGSSRTTGTLFTNDKTWILINAPDPIGGEDMKLIIESLRPVVS
jgi:hypothetical protein